MNDEGCDPGLTDRRDRGVLTHLRDMKEEHTHSYVRDGENFRLWITTVLD